MEEKKPRVGIWASILKIGGKLFSFFIKMLKGLKLVKIGLAGASFVGYAALYSWKFALLLMVAIGFHESGHVWAMKKMGMKTKGFYFLPFIGGAAIQESAYQTYAQNVFIVIMGPLWGAALAYVCGALYWITGNPLWAATAAWMATLNIFNLFPINPLDGGQLVRSIAFSINKTAGIVFLFLSMLMGMVATVWLKIGLLGFITMIGVLELWKELRDRNKEKLKKERRAVLNKILKKMPDDLKPYEGFVDDINLIENNKHPSPMNKNQLILSCLSFIGTLAILILLLKLTAHVPGADLAHNFLE